MPPMKYHQCLEVSGNITSPPMQNYNRKYFRHRPRAASFELTRRRESGQALTFNSSWSASASSTQTRTHRRTNNDAKQFPAAPVQRSVTRVAADPNVVADAHSLRVDVRHR